MSGKHTLALTNRGRRHDRRPAGAGARDPRRRAERRSTSTLRPEPVLVNCGSSDRASRDQSRTVIHALSTRAGVGTVSSPSAGGARSGPASRRRQRRPTARRSAGAGRRRPAAAGSHARRRPAARSRAWTGSPGTLRWIRALGRRSAKAPGGPAWTSSAREGQRGRPAAPATVQPTRRGGPARHRCPRRARRRAQLRGDRRPGRGDRALVVLAQHVEGPHHGGPQPGQLESAAAGSPARAGRPRRAAAATRAGSISRPTTRTSGVTRASRGAARPR